MTHASHPTSDGQSDPAPGQTRGPATPPPLRRRRLRIAVVLLAAAVVTLLLVYALVWASRFTVGELGPFAPLALVLAVGLLAAVLGPVLLVHYREPLRAAIIRSATGLWARLQATGLLQRFAARYPRLARFLAARLSRTATGLGLTLGVIAAGAALWVVLELTVEVVTGSPTVGIDHRILNLVAILRTPALDQVMLIVTFLGNAQTIVVLAAVAVVVALAAGRGRDAVLLILALVASALFFNALKLLVARPRARVLVLGLSAFDGLAIVSAGMLAATGSLNATIRLTSLLQLVTTAYGRTLAVKIEFFLLMVLAGNQHGFVWRPRLARALAASPQREPAGVGGQGHKGALVGRAQANASGTGTGQGEPSPAPSPDDPGDKDGAVLSDHVQRLADRLEDWLRREALLGVAVLLCVALLGAFAGTLVPAAR